MFVLAFTVSMNETWMMMMMMMVVVMMNSSV